MIKMIKNRISLAFDRVIAEYMKDGVRLADDEGNVTGMIIDTLELKDFPKAKKTFIRIVDEVVQNGFYTRDPIPKKDTFINLLFRTEQTGLIADSVLLNKTVLEPGDYVEVTVIPQITNSKYITIIVEYIEKPKSYTL